MEKVLSFAIPCYNVEQYLDNCMKSILVQECLDRIEVIIVNDGSSDKTEEIARGYEQKYSDTVKVITKENGGHGSGINEAMKIACGKYFKVIDADDWIVSDHLANLLDILEETNAGAVINSFETVDLRNGRRTVYSLPASENNRLVPLEELVGLYPQIHSCCSIHGLIYHLQAYRDAAILLSEKVFYEDCEYATLPFSNIKDILLLNFVFYQYQIGNGNQSVAIENQIKRISHYLHVARTLVDFQINNTNSCDSAKKYMFLKTSGFIVSLYSVALVRNPDKKAGRHIATGFRKELYYKFPLLAKYTDKKYIVLLFMNLLHIPYSIYDHLTQTKIYSHFRLWWGK